MGGSKGVTLKNVRKICSFLFLILDIFDNVRDAFCLPSHLPLPFVTIWMNSCHYDFSGQKQPNKPISAKICVCVYSKHDNVLDFRRYFQAILSHLRYTHKIAQYYQINWLTLSRGGWVGGWVKELASIDAKSGTNRLLTHPLHEKNVYHQKFPLFNSQLQR